MIISNGEIDFRAMKRNNLDFDQLHTLLRQQNIFSVREVAFAVFETNGNISVKRKSSSETINREDLQLPEKTVSLPMVLIENGRVQKNRLKRLGRDEQWLINELQPNQISRFEDVLYAEWSDDKGIYMQKKN